MKLRVCFFCIRVMPAMPGMTGRNIGRVTFSVAVLYFFWSETNFFDSDKENGQGREKSIQVYQSGHGRMPCERRLEL